MYSYFMNFMFFMNEKEIERDNIIRNFFVNFFGEYFKLFI